MFFGSPFQLQPKKKNAHGFLRSENLLHPGAVVVADNVLKPGVSGPRGGKMGSWADGWESPKLMLARWWFEIFVIFILSWGKSSNLTNIFQMG